MLTARKIVEKARLPGGEKEKWLAFTVRTTETVAWNIFDASSFFAIEGKAKSFDRW